MYFGGNARDAQTNARIRQVSLAAAPIFERTLQRETFVVTLPVQRAHMSYKVSWCDVLLRLFWLQSAFLLKELNECCIFFLFLFSRYRLWNVPHSQTAVVRGLPATFADSLKIDDPAEPINMKVAHEQKEKYSEMLQSLGLSLVKVPADGMGLISISSILKEKYHESSL